MPVFILIFLSAPLFATTLFNVDPSPKMRVMFTKNLPECSFECHFQSGRVVSGEIDRSKPHCRLSARNNEISEGLEYAVRDITGNIILAGDDPFATKGIWNSQITLTTARDMTGLEAQLTCESTSDRELSLSEIVSIVGGTMQFSQFKLRPSSNEISASLANVKAGSVLTYKVGAKATPMSPGIAGLIVFENGKIVKPWSDRHFCQAYGLYDFSIAPGVSQVVSQAEFSYSHSARSRKQSQSYVTLKFDTTDSVFSLPLNFVCSNGDAWSYPTRADFARATGNLISLPR